MKELTFVPDSDSTPGDVLEDDDGADVEVVAVAPGGVLAVPASRGLVIAGVFPHLPPVHHFEPNLGLVRRQPRIPGQS